jgi:3'(2'), 5'-bisphosphate nucleotidase
MNPLQHHDIEKIVEIAQAAGRAIMGIRETGVVSRQKQDASPVTVADEAANELITRSLGELDFKGPVVSEEGAKQASEHYWLVDPLDGTKEFISGSSEFTVNIALVSDGAVVFGVVHVPASGTTYWGGKSFGAKKIEHGVARDIRVTAGNISRMRIAVSRSHLDDSTMAYLSKYENHELIPSGSSLKLCLVAEGSADIYPRFGRTMEWDIGAGQAVLEGAGGGVFRRETLESLSYTKPKWENPSFIAASSRDLINP